MNLTVEYQPITELFRNAHTEGRHFLYDSMMLFADASIN